MNTNVAVGKCWSVAAPDDAFAFTFFEAVQTASYQGSREDF